MKQEKTAEIYRDGRHYDQMFGDPADDLPFWLHLASQYGDPILELACGTGRLTLPLAQAGFRVTGIDITEGMLKEARRKSIERGVAVTLVKADMRDFNLDQKFALIFLPANTVCHLLDLADVEACLSRVRQHLLPEGRFAISVFVPKLELLLGKPGERFPFAEYDDPDGRGRIVVTESYVYEPDTQIKRVKTHFSIPGQAEEIVGELNLHMYFPRYLDALLKYNGLVIEHKYGDYDRRAFNGESENQLVVCRLAGAGD